jgi:hypothetical protein
MDAITTDLDSLNPHDTIQSSARSAIHAKQMQVKVHGGRKRSNEQAFNSVELPAPARLEEVVPITRAGEKAERVTLLSSITLKPDPSLVPVLTNTRSNAILITSDDAVAAESAQSRKEEKNMTFDNDMHAIARVHLLSTAPSTEASVAYVTISEQVAAIYFDNDWITMLRIKLKEYSRRLSNIEHKADTLIAGRSPDDPFAVDIRKQIDARKTNALRHQHRLDTRERHNNTRIERMKEELKSYEHKLLMLWENVKRPKK